MSMPTLSATSPTLINPNNPTTTTNPRERYEAAVAAAASAFDEYLAAKESYDLAFIANAATLPDARERYHKARAASDAASNERFDALRAYSAHLDISIYGKSAPAPTPAPAPKPPAPPSPTITACRITACRGYGHDHDIMVTLDGKEESLYSFFCDEKSYRAADFVGMTRDAAIAKLFGDDQRYLRG